MDGTRFVATTRHESSRPEELSLLVGDVIYVSKIQGDLYFGRSDRTSEEGWTSATLGYVRQESPYSRVADKSEDRKLVFRSILTAEQAFTGLLKDFIDSVIAPLGLRDTPFKRKFLGESAVAVSFHLLQEMHSACSTFQQLLAVQSDAEVASAYTQFSPSLQLFAQYAVENPKLLNTVKSNRRELARLVPERMDVIATLIQPVEHCASYKRMLQEYFWLSSPSPELALLDAALDGLMAQTHTVEQKIREEEQSWQLLNLQAQFSGNPVIFTSTRRLIKEGEVERVRDTDVKVYYAHLFNDAFIYSQRNVAGGYKLYVAVDLRGAELRQSGACFSVVPSSDKSAKQHNLRFASSSEASKWFPLIKAQIAQLGTRRDKRADAVAELRAVEVLPGVDQSKLGPRCRLLHWFIACEVRFAESMRALNVVALQPLIQASRGAVLSAVQIEQGASEVSLKDAHSGALFDKNAASMSKSKAGVIRDALQEPDVQVFLCAAEGIASVSSDFASALESLCRSAGWAEEVQVGALFTSAAALSLYNHFKAYADGHQAALRVLRSAPFAPFYAQAEAFLAVFPGSLAQKIEAPRQRVAHIADFLAQLSLTHSADLQGVQGAIEVLREAGAEIETRVLLKQNFETLLTIQASFLGGFNSGTDQVVQQLASMSRRFIKEGDLKKVCRKKNKTFRFWLFHDLLLYGSSLGVGSYSLNRSLDLATLTVRRHGDAQNAFEILGAEKSFIVVAASAFEMQDWVDCIRAAKSALAGAGLAAGAGEEVTAPLWVPDNGADGCTVCQKSFTMWFRKHHCRKCGALVCGDHLQRKLVLPYIHKTLPQKVCDSCFASPVSASPAPASAAAKGAAPPPKPPRHAENTSNGSSTSTLSSAPAAPRSPAPSTAPSAVPTHPTAPAAPSSPAPTERPRSARSTSPLPMSATPTGAPPPPSKAAPALPAAGPPSFAPGLGDSGSGGTHRIAPTPPTAQRSTSPAPAPAPDAAAAPTAPTAPVAPRAPASARPDPPGPPKFSRRPPPPPTSLPPPPAPASLPPPPAPASAPASLPPPPAPAPAPAPAPPADPASDHLYKYRKMRDMLPEGAVRQKMASEGYPMGDIDAFLQGQEIPPVGAGASAGVSAGVSAGASLSEALLSTHLRSAPATPPPPRSQRTSMLDEIASGGRRLKAVAAVDARMTRRSVTGGGGLLGMLAMQMSQRRFHLQESDTDSDDGFSDSDSG